MLSYDEFKRLVPTETANFIDFALPYLDYYSKDNRSLAFKKIDDTSRDYYSKCFFLLIYAMAQNRDYETYFSKYGFEKERFKLEKDSANSTKSKDELFNLIGAIIPTFEDLTKYETLTPIDILLPVLDNYNQRCSQAVFYNLFSRNNDFSAFKRDLEKHNNSKKAEQEKDLEQSLYGNLPITVISYLETASKIRTLLFQKINNNQTDILKKLEEDIVPVSLLLASFYYRDTPIYIEENVSEQSAIIEFLSSKGISLDKILQNLSISMGVRELAEVPKNIIAIKNLYYSYTNAGHYEGKSQSEVSVRGIIENVFNREFTNSVAVEKLFAKMNCYIGMFDNFDSAIKQHIETQKRKCSLEYVKSFYGDLPKEAREFADFTAKIYLLLLQKMKENKHNSKLLFAEDDADTLALLIATYYFNGDVSEFFTDYGITLEKILSLLNISMTKEEIEAVELNQKVLVDRYKRFFYEGVNRGKYAKSLTINDIAHNLCNRGFNRSMIMESIFSELTDEMDLESDFLEQLETHLEKKENTRKMKLTQKLFRDIPVESVEFLENTSRIHNYLLQELKNWSQEDIKSVALLLGLLLSPDTNVRDFFNHQGFTKEKICSYLGINSNYLLNFPIDIDLLSKEYGTYIFGGKNKNKGREALMPIEIAKNIFSKEINNSVVLSKFLAHFNQSYDNYANFDENYQAYIEETKEQKRQVEAQDMIETYSSSVSSYLFSVFRIHSRIFQQLQSGNLKSPLLTGEDDVRELSMLLGLFEYSSKSRGFFEKNEITFENILNACGLKHSIFDNLRSEPINFAEMKALYSSYLEKDADNYRGRRSIDDLVKRIFDNTINESMLLENLAVQVGANYDILREEVETGKDYELSLTIDDRISLLSSEAIDTLDLSDIKSVLHFGNSLSVHSKYIHDELPKLMLSDEHQNSIDTINDIINRVYEKQSSPAAKKKGFFARLFSLSVEDEEVKYVLNASAVEELKAAIDTNISKLSKELLGYDAIRKYIEVYRRKNRSHYRVASDTALRLQEQLGSLDPQKDEEYARFLTVSSQLQIMTDKSNRFATTNHLMQQELLKVNQAIVNHFITINALEMARDDLLPLVGSELALGQGRSTENQSLELSQNVMHLFQSLLDRNVDSAVENMEQLRRSNLSADIFASLNRDIEVYLQGLNQAGHIEDRIEYLDIDQLSGEETSQPGMPNPGEINLTLTPNVPKQKTLGTIPKNSNHQ